MLTLGPYFTLCYNTLTLLLLFNDIISIDWLLDYFSFASLFLHLPALRYGHHFANNLLKKQKKKKKKETDAIE